ncbi:30S ribosomal protein S2 [Yunchengibacter salinarum]|uniref:30S ribosomal protein S2 n=1 Tax=Yunchengibacter salinarum TaxID=3133399 RepID=UPI0035B63A03
MALPQVDMRALLEAGVHFGHQTHRWNPKMGPFIFGERNGIHIVDLSKTVPYLTRAMEAVRETVAGGGRVLFVGTKRQASPIVAEAAKRSGQYYVNNRWLGGMMTNWKTISHSIRRLKQLDEMLKQDQTGLTKKEILQSTRERDKLELSLGGIQDMGGLPDLMFIVDINRDTLAAKEANRLGIPVAAIVDTNSDPDGIAYPIPGNDDATRALRLYCDLIADSALDGIQQQLAAQGVDTGAQADAGAAPAAAPASEDAAPEAEAPAAPEAAAEGEAAKS